MDDQRGNEGSSRRRCRAKGKTSDGWAEQGMSGAGR